MEDLGVKSSDKFQYYENEDGTVTIYRYQGIITYDDEGFPIEPIYEEDVSIPKTLNGKTVTALGKNILPGGVVRTLTVPSTVTQISEEAFVSAKKSIQKINVAASNSKYSSIEGILYNKNQTQLLFYPQGREDKEFEVPSGVEKIGAYAFYKAENLEKVILPSSVITLEEYCFAEHEVIWDIIFKGSAPSFGEHVFAEDDSVVVYVPVDELDSFEAFANAYENVLLKSSVTNRYTATLTGAMSGEIMTDEEGKLQRPTAKEESAYSYLYYLCNGDQKVQILPEEWPLALNENVEIWVEKGTEVKTYTYTAYLQSDGTFALTSYRVSDGNVNVPDSIDGKKITAIEADTFQLANDDFDIMTITIPASISRIDARAFRYCLSATEIIIDKDNTSYCSVNSVIYNKDKTKLIYASMGDVPYNFEIPSSVTEIGDYAEVEATNLWISEKVTKIGNSAFGKGTQYVCFDGKAPKFGTNVFSYCNNVYYLSKYQESFKTVIDKYPSVEWISVETLKPIVTFTGCFKEAIMSDAEYKVYRPTQLEEVGYIYTYKLSTNGYREIQESDWPIIIQENCNISVSRKQIEPEKPEWEYSEQEDSTIKISKYNGSATEVVIPEMFEGKIVTEVALNAFVGHTEIVSMLIPKTVEKFETGWFVNCSGLQNVFIDDEHPAWVSIDGIVYDKACTTLLYCPTGRKDGTVSIVESVVSIEDEAFVGSDLTEIVLPDDITTIGESAFRNSKLKTIQLPKQLKKISGRLFSNCTELEKVVMSDEVTEIGNSAFAECYRLSDITLSKALRSIGNDAFYRCQELVTLCLPDLVIEIGDGAFMYCNKLKIGSFPQCLKKIGEYAFYSTTAFEEIVIPESVNYIGNSAFYINSVGNIGYTFLGQAPENLSKAIKNSSENIIYIKEIYQDTYQEAINILQNVRWYTHKSLYKAQITGAIQMQLVADSKQRITRPSKCEDGKYEYRYYLVTEEGEKEILDQDWPLTLESDVIIRAECAPLEDKNGFLYQRTGWNEAVIVGYEGMDTELVVPNKIGDYKIVGISDYAFAECNNITSASLLESMELGRGIFANCKKLKYVYLGEEFGEFATEMFLGCTSLKKVVYSDDLGTIGDSAFEGCQSLTSISFTTSSGHIGSRAFAGCTGLKEVLLSSETSYIGSEAFLNCSSLTELTISSSGGSYTGARAFSGCSALKKLYYLNKVQSFSTTAVDNVDTLGIYIQKADQTVFASAIRGNDKVNWVIKKSYNYTEFYGAFNVLVPANAKNKIERPAAYEKDGMSYTYQNWDDEIKSSDWPVPANNVNDEIYVVCKEKTSNKEEDGFKYRVIGSKWVRIVGYTGTSSKVVIPEKLDGKYVTEIGSKVFYNNDKIKSVTMADTITNIAYNAFIDCDKLTTVKLSQRLKNLPSFKGCSNLKNISIPATITSMTSFENCNKLTDLVIPQGMLDANMWAFKGCSGLTDVYFSQTRVIYEEAFYNCSNLKTVVLNDGTKQVWSWRIEVGAFANCKKLETLVIPDAVKKSWALLKKMHLKIVIL